MIARTFLTIGINLTFLVAADLTLLRSGMSRLLHLPFVVTICALSVIEAYYSQHVSIVKSTAEAVAIACLLTSVASDVATGLILDSITFPSIAALLVLSAAADRFDAAVAGAASCATLIAVLYALSKGRGIGLGDAKLATCIGTLLGPFLGLQSIGLAFTAGGVVAAALLLTGRGNRKTSVAFAPYLAAGTVAVMALQKS